MHWLLIELHYWFQAVFWENQSTPNATDNFTWGEIQLMQGQIEHRKLRKLEF